jgi:cytochrome c biogenesis protein CcdA
MSLMAFMEYTGTSNISLVAAFFIGLMTAISPCPLTTNITAIAYISKRIKTGKHTLIVGFLYTLGRAFTYILISMMIVFFGLKTQSIALFLQKYGERLLGPLLILIGVVMLDVLKFNFLKKKTNIKHNKISKKHFYDDLKEKIAKKGYLGSFLLGVLFALAFCPFSAVLFFGMLIPLAINAKDAILIPFMFSFATGLPVIIFSFILVFSISKLGTILNKVQTFEKYVRKIVAILFICVGISYVFMFLF